jgi:hypothetical protein
LSTFWRNVKNIQYYGKIFSQTTKNNWLGVEKKEALLKITGITHVKKGHKEITTINKQKYIPKILL